MEIYREGLRREIDMFNMVDAPWNATDVNLKRYALPL